MDRVFLDANILFSAAYKPTSRLRELWTIPKVTLLSSSYAVAEAEVNLARTKAPAIKELESDRIIYRIVDLYPDSEPVKALALTNSDL